MRAESVISTPGCGFEFRHGRWWCWEGFLFLLMCCLTPCCQHWGKVLIKAQAISVIHAKCYSSRQIASW